MWIFSLSLPSTRTPDANKSTRNNRCMHEKYCYDDWHNSPQFITFTIVLLLCAAPALLCLSICIYRYINVTRLAWQGNCGLCSFKFIIFRKLWEQRKLVFALSFRSFLNYIVCLRFLKWAGVCKSGTNLHYSFWQNRKKHTQHGQGKNCMRTKATLIVCSTEFFGKQNGAQWDIYRSWRRTPKEKNAAKISSATCFLWLDCRAWIFVSSHLVCVNMYVLSEILYGNEK